MPMANPLIPGQTQMGVRRRWIRMHGDGEGVACTDAKDDTNTPITVM